MFHKGKFWNKCIIYFMQYAVINFKEKAILKKLLVCIYGNNVYVHGVSNFESHVA